MYLVRKRALGDVLWIEPVIRALASRHRTLKVFTMYSELFANYPLPNVRFLSTLPFSVKILIRLDRLLGTRWFSIDLDGAYEHSPNQPMLLAYQAAAGLPPVPEYPRIYLSEGEKAMETGVDGPFVILHLESLTPQNYRKVYGIDWAQVTDALHRMGYAVVQLGKEPVPIPGAIIRRTSLREMIGLIARSAMFIGLDSGPSHIAASLGIPSLLFFGAVNPEYRHFLDLRPITVLQGPCPFAGCYHRAPEPDKLVCRVVGPEGLPPCSVHSTKEVLESIGKLYLRGTLPR